MRHDEIVPDLLVRHIADPLDLETSSLTGDYLWQNATKGGGEDGFRPLNLGAEHMTKVA